MTNILFWQHLPDTVLGGGGEQENKCNKIKLFKSAPKSNNKKCLVLHCTLGQGLIVVAAVRC